MATLRDALVKAKLVKRSAAQQFEGAERERLRRAEASGGLNALMRANIDEREAKRDENYHRQAAREGTKTSSNAGSPEYLKRFK